MSLSMLALSNRRVWDLLTEVSTEKGSVRLVI